VAASADGSLRAYDESFMDEARAEAERGRGFTSPNPVVGALIVDESRRDAGGRPLVLARGYHAQLGGDHAEVAALRALGSADAARGMTLYVTLEPCNHIGRTGRCTDAVLAAGLARVVCGMRDPNPRVQGGGIDRLRAAGVDVTVGVREPECREQNRGFVRAHSEGRPQTLLKAALSLDGRIAPGGLRRQTGPIWLTSPQARAVAHRLRAESDAILVGVGTVLADDPRLSVRLPERSPSRAELSGSPDWPQPLRVVVDSQLRTPSKAQLLGPGALIFTCQRALAERSSQAAALTARGAELVAVPTVEGSERLDLRAVLQRLCANDVDVAPGRVVYTAMLNERGGIESDLTVLRVGEREFFVLTGSAQATRDFAWIERHIGGGEHATLVDVTGAYSIVSVMGPKAQPLLESLSSDAFGRDAIPFSSSAIVDVGYARVRACRKSYVGGPGYELTVPVEQCVTLYEALGAAGARHGLRDAGYYALDALRIEAGRRAWGAELSPDETPWEAGLGHAVKLDKPGGFLGHDALVRQRETGPRKRLVMFTFDDPGSYAWGGEPILMDGRNVGEITSAGYSRRAGRMIAMGYARAEGPLSDEAILAARYQVDIAGVRHAVTPRLSPP
jgi:riboflavin biosynthesis protein RibD